MKWAWLVGVPSAMVAVIAFGATLGFQKPWVTKTDIDALNAVVVENRTLISSNADRLALITYDRLVRKLQAQGRLSPRDLRAFCQAAARLQIRHSVCR